mgnify:CR=1 FL=1
MFRDFLDISEQNTNIEYLSDGSLFPYGCDKDEKVMLVFKCKMHVKGQKNFDELKRCLIYWFERLERYLFTFIPLLIDYVWFFIINVLISSSLRQTNGDQITIFFDMTETGLSNMDMEFSKYLISLNKLYYPSFLNYILIFEMPWVLNGKWDRCSIIRDFSSWFVLISDRFECFSAAFKIIKSWLPARAVQKIKFINKSSIKEYVSPYKMLPHWGGDDNYEFKFVPEVRIEFSNLSCSPSSSKLDETKKKTVSLLHVLYSTDSSFKPSLVYVPDRFVLISRSSWQYWV